MLLKKQGYTRVFINNGFLTKGDMPYVGPSTKEKLFFKIISLPTLRQLIMDNGSFTKVNDNNDNIDFFYQ